MKKIAVGILAHVDAGKTTLSEGLLYLAGEIRKTGRVDHGDAFLDTHAIEKEKGITIFSKQAVLRLGDTELTLLDTPGHVDFSAETERVLNVLDYAVLVVSGPDGVQSHTETLWRLLERYRVPVFVFVNKMDICARTRAELTAELNNRLGKGFTDFTAVESDETQEALAVFDDRIAEKFFEGEKAPDGLIADAVKKRRIFPCLFGSALKMQGVDRFADMLDKLTVRPSYGREFGARVFKISEDERGERLTHMKLTGGALRARDTVDEGEISEKVNQIRIYSGAKFRSTDRAEAGDVCAVTGLTAASAGEGLGFERTASPPVLEPVLSYRVELPAGTDPRAALQKLRQLEAEDPQLHIAWDEGHREIRVRLMGTVQLEVLQRLVRERFGLDIAFGPGSIAYKETIAAPVEGVGHYEPLRHYAEVHLVLEPTRPGSGLSFAADCGEDILDKNWQRLILSHLREKQHIGVLTGSPITDMRITVVGGRAHKKHTEGGDFRQATYRAVRQGLRSAKSVLLEPWYDFRLEIPPEAIGRAMNDLRLMGAEFSQPEQSPASAVITGKAPVSEIGGYHTQVAGYTGGRGRLGCLPGGYRPCHNAEEVIAGIGYDCDADLDNTADSVFCGGGAGFLVPWYQVRDHMHTESGFSFGGEGDRPRPTVREMAAGYVARAAEDKELIKIFERTYGPIKHDRYSMETRREPASHGEARAKKPPSGPEYLLVDGYNIIFAWDELKELAEESLELAREALIGTLSNYRGFSGKEVIAVFDAYRVKGERREVERIDGVDVVYTKEAETADMYIEKVTHRLVKNHRVRVATSDNLEQVIILGGGALRLSAAELHAEISMAEAAIRDLIKEANLSVPRAGIDIPNEE